MKPKKPTRRVREKLTIGSALTTLVLLCIFTFYGVLSNEFIAFDDDKYITDNPHVNTGLTLDNLRWAFVTYQYFYWQPLTWISHMVDVDLFGLDPTGHHFTNLLLHIINVCLLLWVFYRMTERLPASTILAMLYAAHPLRVEAVAWAAERKELLAATFGWLTVAAYHWYTKQPRDYRRYGAVLLLFLTSLMAKPTWVVLPVLLLLLDFWPLRRGFVWKDKLPLLALSLFISLLTIRGQDIAGAVASTQALTPLARTEQSLLNYATYLRLFVWPHPLALLYPLPAERPWWQLLLAATVLLAVSTWVWRTYRQHPERLTGWIWFLVATLPISGLLQSGRQATADRFTYLPQVGLLLLLWPILQMKYQNWLGGAIMVLLILSKIQVTYWRNSISIFEHTLASTGPNVLIEHNLGYVLAGRSLYTDALPHLERSVQIEPRYAAARYNLGRTYAELKRPADAAREFAAATHLNPQYGEAYFSLAVMQAQLGQNDAALDNFRHAVRLPLLADFGIQAESRLGLLLAQTGHVQEAIAQMQAAAAKYPRAWSIHNDLGSILAQQGRMSEAEQEFRTATTLNSGMPGPWKNLGLAQAQQGRIPEARQSMLRAQTLNPDDPQIRALLEQWSK